MKLQKIKLGAKEAGLMAVASSLVLGGCFDPSQKEILEKVQGLKSAEKIATALGPADETSETGAMTLWRYSAQEGDICFSVVRDMALRMACR
ncbi:hypothetical protein [Sneathiella limimaris]|uniref:hypothetical protein n=1 Tax=Sneathiella limimaris TaxID=1964213 RepID=UPI00146F36B4|nr:hypothetical protein [Sneathiella limimaris]